MVDKFTVIESDAVEFGINKNLLGEVNLAFLDPPYSTKIWQRAFFVTKDNEVKNIQIRHRGDNTENWMFEKKHWRIKTRKEEQFDRYRYFNYLPFDLPKEQQTHRLICSTKN